MNKIRCLRILAWTLAMLFGGVLTAKERPMVIVIPSYNNAKWYKRNLESVFNQKYSNYRICYVDDASTDGTGELVQEFVQKEGMDKKVILVRNQSRLGAMENFYKTIHRYIRDHEIVVSLDGDDWLYNNHVLQTINNTYAKGNIWLTHGTLIEWPQKVVSWSQSIPKKIVRKNAFRSFRCPSHMRTFYAWLFKKIRKEDLMIDGKFFPMTCDMAQMFPMIEMAGERHAFIKKITYVYNVGTPLNDNKVNAQLQRDLDVIIRNMPPYERLAKSPIECETSEAM